MDRHSRSRSRSFSPSPSRSPPATPGGSDAFIPFVTPTSSVTGITSTVTPQTRPADPAERQETERAPLSRDDAAFVVGRGGTCKLKIAKASGATLDFRENENLVEITGTLSQRRKAKKYIELVKAQRVGPVYLNPADNKDDDLSIISVPTDCIGYVTGKKGATMRRVEEEMQTLMFFVEGKQGWDNGEGGGGGKLAIFGDRRGRRGTELKIMSAIEQKHTGMFTKGIKDNVCTEPWGTDTMPIVEDLSYALGKGGITRKKLARAANCILEYVGSVAYMAGTTKERSRARDYLSWLMAQRRGSVTVADVDRRDDVIPVRIPSSCVAYVTGTQGKSLRSIEERTGTFCFVDGDRSGDGERLLIFGGDEAGRKEAKSMVLEMVEQKTRRSGGSLTSTTTPTATAAVAAAAAATTTSSSSRHRHHSRSRTRSRSPRRHRSSSRHGRHSRSRSRSHHNHRHHSSSGRHHHHRRQSSGSRHRSGRHHSNTSHSRRRSHSRPHKSSTAAASSSSKRHEGHKSRSRSRSQSSSSSGSSSSSSSPSSSRSSSSESRTSVASAHSPKSPMETTAATTSTHKHKHNRHHSKSKGRSSSPATKDKPNKDNKDTTNNKKDKNGSKSHSPAPMDTK